MNQELIKLPPMAVEQSPPEPTLVQVLSRLVDRGQMTAESVAVAEKVMLMMERQEARQAERSYVAALQALQGSIGKVKATRIVPNNDGGTRFTYADYEEIYDELKPHLDKHGFAWSIVDTTYENNRVFVTGQLRHVSGHKESFRYGVQISAPPKASATQGDGSSISYAKRGCLTSAFNIVVERAEVDAREHGDNITTEQAQTLRDWVRRCYPDELKFLAFATQTKFPAKVPEPEIAKAYLNIGQANLPLLHELLRKREAGKKAAAEATQASESAKKEDLK